jgi:hypothetical protein
MDAILSHTGQNHGCNPEIASFKDFHEKAVSNLQGPTAPSYPQLSAALSPTIHYRVQLILQHNAIFLCNVNVFVQQDMFE